MPDQALTDSHPDFQRTPLPPQDDNTHKSPNAMSPPSEPPIEDYDLTTAASPIDQYPEAEHSLSTHSDDYKQTHPPLSTYSEEESVVDSHSVTQSGSNETLYERSNRALGLYVIKEFIVGHTGNPLDVFWQQRVIRNARGDDGRYDGEWCVK